MCLLAFRWLDHPTYSLIFAGNRDEAYARPTQPARYWDAYPNILGGRDLKAGGTWMGVTRSGRWSVITNVRDPSRQRPGAPSRGHLVTNYLQSADAPEAFACALAEETGRYNAFNLLVGSPSDCWYVSTEQESAEPVSPGIHGMSNAELDTSWPKTDRAKREMRQRTQPRATSNGQSKIKPEILLDMLDNREPYPPPTLPDTGVGLELEKLLSPMFITSGEYGTRASTVLLIRRDGHVTFAERTFERGEEKKTRTYSFDIAFESEKE